MTIIRPSLPPVLREALSRARGSLGDKARQTKTYAGQQRLKYGLISGVLPEQQIQRIGNYDTARISERELSFIHMGRNSLTGQIVALKQSGDPLFDHMVGQEAEVLQRLQANGIVKYLGLVERPHCLVEEFVFGAPVAELHPTFPESLYVALRSLNALKAIHRAGITHPDLNLDNTIVSASGALTYIDFNLSHTANEFSRPEEFIGAKRLDIYLAAHKLGFLFHQLKGPASPAAQLFPQKIKGAFNDLAFPYKTCDEFLGAIYEKLAE